MADKKFACIKQVVKTVQIPLPSMFISNEISGITEILDSWKRQYSKQLRSVVVNYRNLSLTPNGFVIPNKPYVYYNVKATFDLFCPKIGDIVKGMITRISNEHISCVIEGTINVSIHLSYDSPKDLAPFISLNREILFEISSMKIDGKMILNVKGKITRKCIELMKKFFPPPASVSLIDTPECSNNTDEGIGTSSESADDALQNHVFDGLKINDDMNFKKPSSKSTKSKKSKRPKSDSESSTVDTSDVPTSDEKPKKKKKKHSDKSFPDEENYSSGVKLSSDTLFQNVSTINHSEILNSIKKEDLSFEDNTHVKKHKKKHKQDSSPLLLEKINIIKNQTLSQDMSSLDLNNSAKLGVPKLSKKRKRENESLVMGTSQQLIADEKPKKKHKDKTVPLEEVKKEFSDLPDDETIAATLLSLKQEKLSPVKKSVNVVPESKLKKKSKGKKSKEKDKTGKKKSKVLASGAVLKKDKKSKKKSSKKKKLDDAKSKKHKKSKSHKKGKSDKKKKKGSSKKKVSDVIKSEID